MFYSVASVPKINNSKNKTKIETFKIPGTYKMLAPKSDTCTVFRCKSDICGDGLVPKKIMIGNKV